MLSSHLGALQIQREKCQPVISQEEKTDIPRMSAAGNWEQHGQKKSYTEASIPGAQQLEHEFVLWRGKQTKGYGISDRRG